jgi:subtilisin family serine protease
MRNRVALLGLACLSAASAQAREIAVTEDGHPYVKGEMLVKVRSAAQLERMLDRTRSSLGSLAERRPVHSSASGQWYVVKVNEELGASFAARDAMGAGDVLYAEPNYVYSTLIGNKPGKPGQDPDYGKVPKLPDPEVRDPQGSSLYGMRLIDAETAWAVTRGSRDIVVGNIDTGIDYTHPDLINNVWQNPKEIPGNKKDDDGNGFVDDVVGWDFRDKDAKPFDDNSHGSHTAGTIGATGGNGVGVTGVAPRVSIMSLRFLGGANGSGTAADAISAIEYATANGARLTSNSWGGGAFSQALFDAISAANDAGILFVAAAGNSRSDNDKAPAYPASYKLPNILSVAATDEADELASFSNFGAQSVMVAAPGVAILSTVPGNDYKRLSGTSMACPHVSGAAALLLAAYPQLKAQQVRALIMDSVDPVANLKERVLTGGRLNLAKAFNKAKAQYGSPN